MAFKSRLATVTKAERAVLLALSLAILATRAGERVAAIGAPFAPGHTQLTLNRLATWYAASDAADRGEQPPAGHLPRFATCLLISDFLQPLDQITAAWRQFASTGTRGHVVQVLDPAEETFPYAGRTEFEEFSGRDKLIFGRAEKFREPYQQRLHAHQQGLRDLCRRLGWSFTVHHTDRAPNHAILSLFQRISLDKPSHQMVAVGR